MRRRRLVWLGAGVLGTAAMVAGAQAVLTEDEVRERVSRVNADLRSMHTAMESYRVDYDRYPLNLTGLTTPVSYLSSFFQDPFPSTNGGPSLPEEHPDFWFGSENTLKLGISPEERVLVIYSSGPDGLDDGGLVAYDPTNGVFSSGDIRRTLEAGSGGTVFLNPVFQEASGEALAVLGEVRDALTVWVRRNDSLPGTLEQIIGENRLLKSVPEDPLAPGSPIRYELIDDQTAVLYSVGVDGDDDYGIGVSAGIVPSGEIPNGDIVYELSLADLQAKAHPWSHANFEENVSPYLAELLKLKESTGRDNAMIHYVEAENESPGLTPDSMQALLDKAIAEGWSEEAEPLRDWLVVWQDAFENVRRGVAVDAAGGIGITDGYATPVPNYLSAQLTVKALTAQSALRAYEGDTDGAIDDALAAITMGRDFQSEGNVLISHLIGIAARNIALKQVARMVGSGELSDGQLHRISVSLGQLDATTGSLADGFRMEGEMMGSHFGKPVAELLDEVGEGDLKKLGITREELPPLLEEVSQFHELWWNSLVEEISKGWHGMDLEAPDRAVAGWRLTASEPAKRLADLAMPNAMEAATRLAVSQAKLRIVAAEAELRRQSAPPSTLGELSLPRTPIDPFTGTTLRYANNGDGTWGVWALGPDGDSDGGSVVYDPTNGTVSDGDIVFP